MSSAPPATVKNPAPSVIPHVLARPRPCNWGSLRAIRSSSTGDTAAPPSGKARRLDRSKESKSGCSITRTAMVGTPPQRCTPSASIRASTSAGLNRPTLSTIRPPVMTWDSRVASAPTWNSGVQTRLTACGASGFSRCGSCRERTSTFCWLATTPRNDSSTPLGMPELPEVNKMAIGSSSCRGPGSAGSTSAKPPKQRANSATSSTGTSAGTATSASSVITAAGATSAIECCASCRLHHRLPNTGTAPTAQIAHNASTQSGLL